MTTSTRPQSRLLFRGVLLLVLALLVSSAYTVSHRARASVAAPVTTAPTTTTPVTTTTAPTHQAIAHHSHPVTTTTGAATGPTHPASIVVTPFPTSPQSSNCPLHLSSPQPPVTTGTTTSTSTTTSTTTTTLTGTTGSAPQLRRTGGSVAHVVGKRPHCTILEIGDSLGSELGWGLQRDLANDPWITFDQMDKASTGLSNSWFYNWPVQLHSFLATYRPNLLIVCLGGNDEQNINDHGTIEDFGTPAWKKTYGSFIQQILGMARQAGSYVLWVGMPVMQPYEYNLGMQLLNAQFAANVSGRPGTVYLPTWQLLAGPRGQFQESAPVNGVMSVLRSPDGIHFSMAGEDVFSTYVARELGTIFHAPLRYSSQYFIS